MLFDDAPDEFDVVVELGELPKSGQWILCAEFLGTDEPPLWSPRYPTREAAEAARDQFTAYLRDVAATHGFRTTEVKP